MYKNQHLLRCSNRLMVQCNSQMLTYLVYLVQKYKLWFVLLGLEVNMHGIHIEIFKNIEHDIDINHRYIENSSKHFDTIREPCTK